MHESGKKRSNTRGVHYLGSDRTLRRIGCRHGDLPRDRHQHPGQREATCNAGSWVAKKGDGVHGTPWSEADFGGAYLNVSARWAVHRSESALAGQVCGQIRAGFAVATGARMPFITLRGHDPDASRVRDYGVLHALVLRMGFVRPAWLDGIAAVCGWACCRSVQRAGIPTVRLFRG